MNTLAICNFLRQTGGISVDARLFSAFDLVSIAQTAREANRTLVIKFASAMSQMTLSAVANAGGSNVVYEF